MRTTAVEMHRDGEIVREKRGASQRDKGEMETGGGWKESWGLGHKH